MVAAQIHYARERRDQRKDLTKLPESHIQIGDAVLVKNYVARGFEEKYRSDFRVIGFRGKNVVEVRDAGGRISQHHITNVKKTLTADKVANTRADIIRFGRQPRAIKIQLDKQVDLGWDIPPVQVNMLDTWGLE